MASHNEGRPTVGRAPLLECSHPDAEASRMYDATALGYRVLSADDARRARKAELDALSEVSEISWIDLSTALGVTDDEVEPLLRHEGAPLRRQGRFGGEVWRLGEVRHFRFRLEVLGRVTPDATARESSTPLLAEKD